MKSKLLAVLLLAAASAFAAPRVIVGVGVGGYHRGYAYRGYPYRAYSYGAYAAAPVVTYTAPVPYYGAAYYEPPMPGPGYVWIGGWGGRAGYWSRPAHFAPSRGGPRNFGGRYYGDRGRR
jgi:hypothetical protein